MSDDPLQAVWTSGPAPLAKEEMTAAIAAVVADDHADRAQERRERVAAGLALAILCPILVSCAAYGVSPLVRGGYALMAVGTAILVTVGRVYTRSSRQAWPGPDNALAHLQQTAFLLCRQAAVMRLAWLYCAPLFIGAALIGTWIYQQRSVPGASALWVVIASAWSMVLMHGKSVNARLQERRLRIERVLSELSAATDE